MARGPSRGAPIWVGGELAIRRPPPSIFLLLAWTFSIRSPHSSRSCRAAGRVFPAWRSSIDSPDYSGAAFERPFFFTESAAPLGRRARASSD